MSFSDNLENNLKSLEAQEERDPAQIAAERDRKETERQSRIAAAPFAEQLRTSAFTQDLLAHATRIGFTKRTKVYITWLDTTLRLEARTRRLELQPTAAGIVGHFIVDGEKQTAETIDLNGNAEALAQRWLDGLA